MTCTNCGYDESAERDARGRTLGMVAPGPTALGGGIKRALWPSSHLPADDRMRAIEITIDDRTEFQGFRAQTFDVRIASLEQNKNERITALEDSLNRAIKAERASYESRFRALENPEPESLMGRLAAFEDWLNKVATSPLGFWLRRRRK